MFKLCMQVAYWPLMMIWCMAFTNGCKINAIAALKGNFGIDGKILRAKSHFKGHCDLSLAFDCEGLALSHQPGPISYLHAKFEQNMSILKPQITLETAAAFVWPLIVEAT